MYLVTRAFVTAVAGSMRDQRFRRPCFSALTKRFGSIPGALETVRMKLLRKALGKFSPVVFNSGHPVVVFASRLLTLLSSRGNINQSYDSSLPSPPQTLLPLSLQILKKHEFDPNRTILVTAFREECPTNPEAGGDCEQRP